jgi:hypothetical protein
MRISFYFIGSFSSVCGTGTFAQLIVECTTCIFNIIAVCLWLDADTSVSLLFLRIACLDCFDSVNSLMEAVYVQLYVHASANKVRGKITLKNLTN